VYFEIESIGMVGREEAKLACAVATAAPEPHKPLTLGCDGGDAGCFPGADPLSRISWHDGGFFFTASAERTALFFRISIFKPMSFGCGGMKGW
jgi:hypothetical protein